MRKRWLVLLAGSLLLTGCGRGQVMDGGDMFRTESMAVTETVTETTTAAETQTTTETAAPQTATSTAAP